MQHSKNEDHGIQFITSWQINGDEMEIEILFSGAPKSLQMVKLQP